MDTNSSKQPEKQCKYRATEERYFTDGSKAVLFYKNEPTSEDLDKFKIILPVRNGSLDEKISIYDTSKMDSLLKTNIFHNLHQKSFYKKSFDEKDLFGFDLYTPEASRISKKIKTKKGTELLFTYAIDNKTNQYTLDKIRVSKDVDDNKEVNIYDYRTAPKEVTKTETGIEERFLDGSDLVLHYSINPETKQQFIDKITTRTDKPSKDHIYEQVEPEKVKELEGKKKLSLSEVAKEMKERAKIGFDKPAEARTVDGKLLYTYENKDREKIYEYGAKDIISEDTLTEIVNASVSNEQVYEKPEKQEYLVPKKAVKKVSHYNLKGIPIAIPYIQKSEPKVFGERTGSPQVKNGQTIEHIVKNNRDYVAISGREYNTIGKMVRRIYDTNAMSKPLRQTLEASIEKGILPEKGLFDAYVVDEIRFNKERKEYKPSDYLIKKSFMPGEEKKIKTKQAVLEKLRETKVYLEGLLKEQEDYTQLKHACKHADRGTLFKLIQLVDKKQEKLELSDLLEHVKFEDEPQDFVERIKRDIVYKALIKKIDAVYEPVKIEPDRGLFNKLVYKPISKMLNEKGLELWRKINGRKTEEDHIKEEIAYAEKRIKRIEDGIRVLGRESYRKTLLWKSYNQNQKPVAKIKKIRPIKTVVQPIERLAAVEQKDKLTEAEQKTMLNNVEDMLALPPAKTGPVIPEGQ